MAAARRLRAQRPEPAHRRRARGALPELPRPEPDLGGARGHRQALAAVRPAAGRSTSSRARRPCLEAQIVDFADEIAYNSHDIDDGLQVGPADASSSCDGVTLWRETYGASRSQHPAAPASRIWRYQVHARAIIDLLVTDLIATVERAPARRIALDSVDDVRAHGQPIVDVQPGDGGASASSSRRSSWTTCTGTTA